MINHISIKNFAIIENTEIDFHDGLNIITGETGAGKSIVIEAVSLALGSRADSSYVRTGTEKAVIQLAGSLDDEDFVITREISAAGKNLCRINGELVTLAQINRLSSRLADVHGQYDNQSLLDPDYHIVLLDSYRHSDTDLLISAVKEDFHRYTACRTRLSRLLASEKENARQLDFYRFESEEIDKACLTAGEDHQLEQRVMILQNSEKIYDCLNRSYASMSENSPSVLDSLSMCSSSLTEISEFSKDISSLSEEVRDLYYRVEDVCSSLRSLKEDISFSPAELDEAIMRLNTIDGLKKKYGSTIEEILEYRNNLSVKLNDAENFDEVKLSLMKQLKEYKTALSTSCAALTQARKSKAEELESAIQKELEDLNFKDAKVKIAVEPLDDMTENGADKVEILITTNRGEPLKPLYKIVSGGEMSRIMLAFKNIVSSYDNIPTLIFDEIDNGISGITASIVGKKLREISKIHQIICITHLPQIAACGEHNSRIHKETHGDSTCTGVEELNSDEKVREIARLLGGTVITDTTLHSAVELIEASST